MRKKEVNELISSPTDYPTLYSALGVKHEIPASVVGPDRHTLITLDLDLYSLADPGPSLQQELDSFGRWTPCLLWNRTCSGEKD